MLTITVPKTEIYDESKEEFFSIKEQTLCLEHSLLSISKWESKWHKPFIIADPRNRHSNEEMLDYIRCMTINHDVDELVYRALTPDNFQDIKAYIENPMTATTVNDKKNSPFNREIITSEVIYYWMVTLNIPIECEKWHVNRLIMLIKVCSAKSNPQKMSNRAIYSQNRMLNEARKKVMNTKG